MNQPFEIDFDFPLAHSDLIISLRAIAEPHHSDPYYVVDDFHVRGSKQNELSILPSQQIKQVSRSASKVWVHKDSGRESLLSIAIGKAIENATKQRNND